MPALWKFELREYDANWPMLYRVTVAGLEESLPMVTAFEHVGSTSIPGMASVATIDILAGVADLAQVNDSIIDKVIAAGWEHRPDIEALIPHRRFFNQPVGPAYRTTRTRHLHIVRHGSEEWRDPILFRDFLRRDRDMARRYLELKRSLAAKEYENPSFYSAQKAAFVAEVLRMARA